jgi:hypothetical protein
MTLPERIAFARSAFASGTLKRLNTAELLRWQTDPSFATVANADRAWVFELLEQRTRAQAAFNRAAGPARPRPTAQTLWRRNHASS